MKIYYLKAVSIALLSFFSVLGIHEIHAQGPNAPEAAAFEPVDATDMVNLVTGDFTYVLPLLNVPSPEGGYPIALSYHAGIAMDQEASWVGLGWSLNPGAINRSVNGYPDDWGKTRVSEFFYDQGWEEDYYTFGVGATIYGVSVGLGASWGSNRSLGGYVSAGVGIADGAGSIGVTLGTDGVGIYAGINGFSASISTNGVGIGYGFSGGNGAVFGVGLNYNFNSGLSGGLSFTQRYGGYSSKFAKGNAKSSGLGINFSSQGVSINGKINGNNAGISTNTESITSSDYDVTITSNSFFIPIYVFYVSHSHHKVKYSLYKYNNLNTSGSLYPYDSNDTKELTSSEVIENSFMDVNSFVPFHYQLETDILIDDDYLLDKGNMVLLNNDNFIVNAQGLSGSMSPTLFQDIHLFGRGRGEQIGDDIYNTYLTKPTYGNSWYYDNLSLENHLYFNFDNTYNSFLRVNTSNIMQLGTDNPINPTPSYVFNQFRAGIDETYSDVTTPDGIPLKNGHRLRKGNFVKTYTNKQIREGNNISFIEARLLDRSNIKTYVDEGIGAFQITAMDGKTYHYSLPVYNFEVYYKNFVKKDDEDKNFFELQKTKPYATHWLLTAITGPDYVDTNNNGTVDKGDYGYWVEFEYGKWSDGYMWKSPNEGYTVNEAEGSDTYSYYWGRKQLFYLDAIYTRSHVARFIKSERLDCKGWSATKFKQQVDYEQGEFFHQPTHSEAYINQAATPLALESIAQEWHFGHLYEVHTFTNSTDLTYNYMDFPESSVLKLDKIIISKNDDLEIEKSGSNSNTQIGYFNRSKGRRFGGTRIFFHLPQYNYQGALYSDGQSIPIQLTEESDVSYLNDFEINIADEALDAGDIFNLNLEQQADQVIEFEYDYSLALASSNSNAPNNGRLSLKKLHFKGKQDIKAVPPYTFSYNLGTYNKDNKDAWGYHTSPEYCSLNEIGIPTGGRIKIEYEPDSYFAEAAYPTPFRLSAGPSSKTYSGTQVTLSFDTPLDLREYFTIGQSYRIEYTITRYIENPDGQSYSTSSEDSSSYDEVLAVGSNWITFEFNSLYDAEHFLNPDCGPFQNNQEVCIHSAEVIGHNFDFTSTLGNNGLEGGGLRVNHIEVSDGDQSITTEYLYTNPNTSKTSGITSYAPSDSPKGIPYVSEIPAPTVTYGYVTMQTKDSKNALMGKSIYNFETLKPMQDESGYIYSLGDAFKVEHNQNQTFLSGKVRADKYSIYNKQANIGRIKSIERFNSKNQSLSKTTYQYKQNLDADGEIGVTQETFKTFKKIVKDNFEWYTVVSSSKVNYPSVLESSRTYENGMDFTRRYTKYDFLTGSTLETEVETSNGDKLKSEIVPAYEKYPQMGSKVDMPSNKNMLTQEAANYTFIQPSGSSDWKPLNVGITTWRPWDNNIWRKHRSFIWDGELDHGGTLLNFDASNDDNFNWGLATEPDGSDISQPNPYWKAIATTTKYDDFSMALEMMDINGKKAATKMGDNHTKIFATGNAAYDALFYSGAEDDDGNGNYGGEVSKGTAIYGIYSGHSGTKALTVNGSQEAFVVVPGVSDKYKVSVWVAHNTLYNTSELVRLKVGSTLVAPNSHETVIAGSWRQYNFYADITAGTPVSITSSTSSSVYVDDFRMHPMESSMISYVYNEWDELSHILGANNMGVRYEYNSQGKLIRTYQEVADDQGVIGGFKKISENEYHYQNQ